MSCSVMGGSTWYFFFLQCVTLFVIRLFIALNPNIHHIINMKRVLSSSTSQLLVRSFASQPDVAAVREHLLPPVAKLSVRCDISNTECRAYVWGIFGQHNAAIPPFCALTKQDQIVSHGKGSYVWTTDGTKLLDFTGGMFVGALFVLPAEAPSNPTTPPAAIGVLSTGYCHPKVVEAVRQQVGTLIHAGQNIFAASPPLVCGVVCCNTLHLIHTCKHAPPPPQLGLIDRLTEICPSHLSRFFFCNSGSEAVDNAIKIARAATGKQNIIAFKVLIVR